MSVYVDPLRGCCISPRWRWPRSCHLTADTLEELLAFARRTGLKRFWLQDGGKFPPHFDLTGRMRARAVAAGAVEITLREAAERRRRTSDDGS